MYRINFMVHIELFIAWALMTAGHRKPVEVNL